MICLGIPLIYFAALLLCKKARFWGKRKVRQRERLLYLPFSSFIIFPALLLSSVLLVAGSVTGNQLILLSSLLVVMLMTICIEHPKIWFSDTFNVDDAIEKFREVSSEYENGIFSYDDGCFTIRLGDETKTIKWDDIIIINAHKIDRYAVDCIVIDIHFEETSISINDQTAGHMKFMEIAAQQLFHFKKDWFMAVAFPAFETNLINVYKK